MPEPKTSSAGPAAPVADTTASLLGSVFSGLAACAASGARVAWEVAETLVGTRHREVWRQPGRCYIEVSGVHGAEGERVARRIERALEGHPGVVWARVNAPMERVIVEVDAPPPPEKELVALVEGAEGDHAAEEEAFDDWRPEPDHPSEGPPFPWLPALAADTLGLTIATVRRVAPWFGLPAEVAALVDALRAHPRLRHLVEDVGGEEQAESLLSVAGALIQGVATGGGGIALDVLLRVAAWREASAERGAWSEAEPGLVRGPDEASAEAVATERAGPLPQDAVDRFAERSMAIGVGAAAAALPFAGLRRAIAVGVASVPKPPKAGREGFAASLGRHLAQRGVVTMDRTVLRRLGQVDTILLEEDALRGDRYEPIDLDVVNGAEAVEVSERLFALYDPDAPLATHRDGDWVLGPLEELDLDPPTGLDGPEGDDTDTAQPPEAGDSEADVAERVRRRGAERLLGLARGNRLLAVAGLATQSAPGSEAVAAAARRAGARVIVASAREDARIPYADAVVPAGKSLVASLRCLQADGAVVLLVSGNRRALAEADCAVGVHRHEEHTPWGAHLLVGADLEAAALVVDAVACSARVDHDSHILAAGGSGVGAVAALQSPTWRATARVLAIGNTAGLVAFGLGFWRARQLLARPLVPPVTTTPWHLMPVDRVLERLDSRPEGLSGQEAQSRAERAYADAPGPLTLPYAFIDELSNPLTPVLAVGGALAAAVGSRTDAALVAAITSLSALVGGFQRVRTDRALAQLFARSAIGARVRRAGHERLVAAGELVPGDVVVLGPEDVVPADCRLLEADGLEVDESSLTGESLAVTKGPAPVVASHIQGRTSMLYEGTSVSSGHGVAVVVATGAATEAGRSLATARQSAPETGVESRLSSLTRSSIPIALGSALAVTLSGLLHGKPLTENLASAVNLAVASVPEGLPFLVNAAQLAAARRLADVGALVRNPRTIEALGRADVLCFDKTGTLTEGTLRLSEVHDGDTAAPLDGLGSHHKYVLAAALRATPAARQAEPMAHQTDRAVLDGGRRARVGARTGAARWHHIDTLPFEPARSYHATTGQTSGGVLLSVKGAPENVIARCTGRRPAHGQATELDDAARARLATTAEELAAAGRRVLAVAERRMRDDEELTDETVRDLILLGFVTLSDPLRSSAAPATARLRAAGVQTVMLTGDHPATADAIASAIGDMADDMTTGTDGATTGTDETVELTIRTGPELDELDDDALDELLPTVDVIARCSPAHKVRIVQAYQRLGRVVAMTGDGANDAPAIRLADIGIALGHRGTPAATAAADLVVTDDRLETIVAALTEGRAMWASVRTALAILIGGNLGEVAFSVLASAVTGVTPLNARQIMLVNLLTDLAPSLAIAMREPSGQAGERLLEEGPTQSLSSALTHEMLHRGVVTAIGAGLAWTVASLTGRPRRAGTVALAAVVGTQLVQTLTTGGTDRNVLVAGLGSAAVLLAIIQVPGVSRFFGCVPLGPVAWGIVLGSITAAVALGYLWPSLREIAGSPASFE
ncbi:cation-translocating P-type ATPase [Streptomyces sp. RerS4]|uniref:cation-translocating P-type ATPase n=1 Tax=Streptomyces sp. RerS4 TaxID=2942449 RepID=UPI00201C833D|nr:cation-translocating P-type ATPase [Streptomyces sp. RerS4]UQW99477.1 cation-translocating P-type ATPase [Streptomyces sp. RerS4]